MGTNELQEQIPSAGVIDEVGRNLSTVQYEGTIIPPPLPPAQPPSSGIIYRLLLDKWLLSYPHSYYYIAMFTIIVFIINTIRKKRLVRFKINEELDIFNRLKRRIFLCVFSLAIKLYAQ